MQGTHNDHGKPALKRRDTMDFWYQKFGPLCQLKARIFGGFQSKDHKETSTKVMDHKNSMDHITGMDHKDFISKNDSKK